MSQLTYLCLDCAQLNTTEKLKIISGGHQRCVQCKSPRLRSHPELETLHIAHIDCDSFYASVEKMDNPELAGKPVVVGNKERGVAAASCYVARSYGIKSAMPMFQILKLCPDIVIIPARMERYQEVGMHIREMFKQATPLTEPVSIDEAYLDLSGLETLTGKKPCQILAQLIIDIKKETGIQVSAGLAPNKFLAKTASDLEKPKGYSIIGQAEAQEFLAPRPIESMFGVGKSLASSLKSIGIQYIGDLRRYSQNDLIKKLGVMGHNLYYFARGIDNRPVEVNVTRKSIGKEHSFSKDVVGIKDMDKNLYYTAMELTDILKYQGCVASTISLKIRNHKGKSITRSVTLSTPTNLLGVIYGIMKPILQDNIDENVQYRLLGLSATGLKHFDGVDILDLGDPNHLKNAQKERVLDKINKKMGENTIIMGKHII